MSILGEETKQLNQEEVVDNIELLGNMDTTNMIATVDADTLVYAVCSICESGDDEAGYIINLEYALEEACKRVEKLLEITRCNSIELHFTSGKNFRFSLTGTYKANRKGDRTPAGLSELKKLMLTKYEGEIHTEFEADDIVCTQKQFNPDRYIVCSPDKDVYNGVAGTHLNYFKRAQGKNKWGTVLKAIPMRFVLTTEAESLVWVHMQVLMGDSSDGIAGIDKCGPVGALTILCPEMIAELTTLKKEFKKTTGKDADLWKDIVIPHRLLNDSKHTRQTLWDSVVNAYTAAGLEEKLAILNMRLVNMHQMTEDGQLDLWTVPTKD